MSINIAILVLYFIAIILIVAFLSLYDFLNKPRFRSSESDSTEAGYLEDGIGNPLSVTLDDELESSEMPHVEAIGGTRMGSL